MMTTSTGPDVPMARASAAAAPEVRPHGRRLRASSLAMAGFVALCLACFIQSVRAPIGDLHGGGSNLHAHQARAFLSGHLDVDAPGFFDSASYKGRTYDPFPPMPAVLMMPIVALVGIERTNGPLLCRGPDRDQHRGRLPAGAPPRAITAR